MMKTSKRQILTSILFAVCSCGSAIADEPDSLVDARLTSVFVQDDTPTIPETIVRPPETDADTANSGDEVPPPTSATPTTPAVPFTSDNFTDSNLRSPSVGPSTFTFTSPVEGLFDTDFGQSDLFGDNTGALRGGLSLFDAPIGASIRSQDEIRRRQAPDMFHALQNEVGVLMQSTAAGQASPFVRGLTGQQVLILIDGIRLNNSITRRGPNQYMGTLIPVRSTTSKSFAAKGRSCGAATRLAVPSTSSRAVPTWNVE